MTNSPYAGKKAPINLATWSVLSLNLSARDKVIKIIQYAARLLIWYYQRINAGERSLLAIQKVKEITSLSRRSFRFFRSIIHVNRIYNAVSELIDDSKITRLDDTLITSVGILEDILLVMYFGYENYLFCVATKILKITNESETAIRNSSGLVSLIGSFARILGVCLRLNRSTNEINKRRRKLDSYVEMMRVFEHKMNLKLGQEEYTVKERADSDAAMISNNINNGINSNNNNNNINNDNNNNNSINNSNNNNQEIIGGLWERVENDRIKEDKESNDSSSDDFSFEIVAGKEESKEDKEKKRNSIIEKDLIDAINTINRNMHEHNNSQKAYLINQEKQRDNRKGTTIGSIGNIGSNKEGNEGRSGREGKDGTERREGKEDKQETKEEVERAEHHRLHQLLCREKEKLECDLYGFEEEKKTLRSDAVVVTLELIISCNYRPFCIWERMFGYKVINEGHEGVVGLISSFYVLNSIWPYQDKSTV